MAGPAKSLSKGGIYYLLYNVLNMAFPFLTGIYVARILLPENIGTVTAAQNVAEYFVILAFLGIPTYGMREIARARNNPVEKGKVYSELLVINAVSTAVFLTAYLAVVLLVPEYRSSLPLYLITGGAIALNVCNNSWLYDGLEEFRFISVRNMVFKAVCFAALLVFVREPGDYMIYAAITVAGTAGNYIVNMAWAPKFVRFTSSGLNLKRHLKPIFSLVAVNLAIELYSLMDITMMNFMCDKDHIAFYRYGSLIQKMLLQVVSTFTMVLVPRISLYYQEKREKEFNALVSRGFSLIVLISLPMISGIFFTSDFLITALYGSAYENSAMILKMLSVLLLISPVGYLLGSRILLVTGHENRMILCVGIGAVINLIGNALLIPRYGEFGAAGASVFSEIAVMVVYVRCGRKYFRLAGVGESAWKAAAACGAMTAWLVLCGCLPAEGWPALVLQVGGAVAVYGGALILLKEPVTARYVRLLAGKFRKG